MSHSSGGWEVQDQAARRFGSFFDNSYPDRCEVISCGFETHLPDD